MKKGIFSFIGLSTLLLFSFASYSEETKDATTPTTATAASKRFNWSGIYGGIQTGHGWSRVDWTFYNGANREKFNQSRGSWFYGAQIGAQYQCGNIITGIEGMYVYPWSSNWVSSLSSFNFDAERESRLRSIWLITPRVGYAWDRWMAYIKGGYASGIMDLRTLIASTGEVTTTNSARNGGLTGGAGVDYAFCGNFIFGVEYDYVNFNSQDRNLTPTPLFLFPSPQATGISSSLSLLTARLEYKF